MSHRDIRTRVFPKGSQYHVVCMLIATKCYPPPFDSCEGMGVVGRGQIFRPRPLAHVTYGRAFSVGEVMLCTLVQWTIQICSLRPVCPLLIGVLGLWGRLGGGIGRTHEITRGRGQSSRGACAQIGVSVPEVWIYRPQAFSLEGKSIHVCIQLCTHVYTTVYTRVHNFALSMSAVELP